jgi:hypothetical protein
VHKAVSAGHVNQGSAVYFEVPNSLYTLRDMGIWDIIYEHCGYFCENSLSRVFTENGFVVQRLNDSFGRQFLSIETTLASDQENSHTDIDMPAVRSYATAFEKKYEEKVEAWKERLESYKKEGKRVSVWGAGSKGVTFLNALKVGEEIGNIVDLNVNKQGKFVPGTGHQVVSPDHLKEYQPDIVIVMNPIYTDEIAQSLKDMGVNATMVAE